jgi:hypothetical protein
VPDLPLNLFYFKCFAGIKRQRPVLPRSFSDPNRILRMRPFWVGVCQPKLANKDSLHSILFPFHEFISVYGLLPVHKKETKCDLG